MRYGHRRYPQNFSRPSPAMLPYFIFGPLRPGLPTPGSCPSKLSLCLNLWRLRNFHRMCIGYAFRPHLSSRLTWSGRTFLQKPLSFGHYDSHIILATHSGNLTRMKSTTAFAMASPLIRRSPTPALCASPSFGVRFSPVKFSAQGHSTSELLRTLLMSGCF